jgi:TonB family protein
LNAFPKAVIAVGAFVVLATARPARAQDFVSIFNGTNLTGWKVENASGDVRDGVVHVGNGNGWVRTERPYSDFVLKLDVRVGGEGEDATAGIFVRSWPTFDDMSSPNNGSRVTVKGSADFGGWHHVEIDCVGRTLSALVDGSSVFMSDMIANPQGYLALNASPGSAEFKSIEIKEYPVPQWDVPLGVFTAKDHVVFPLMLVEGKPRYTSAAMAAKIQGGVFLTAVVQPDGTIDQIVVRRSLDPRFGLDREAVAAAQKWRFTPGTRDGQPVPVLISMELTFTLK